MGVIDDIKMTDGNVDQVIEILNKNKRRSKVYAEESIADAVEKGHKDLVELFLDKYKVDPNWVRNIDRKSILTIALENDRIEIVKLLLVKYHVEPDVPNYYGESALSNIEKYSPEMQSLFLDMLDKLDKNIDEIDTENYLETRIKLFRQFQDILHHPNSLQCGDHFTLFIDGKIVYPKLKLLGSGHYGIAFELISKELSKKSIHTVVKASVNDNKTLEEIRNNLLFSEIVEKGGPPHFPLFAKCKPKNNHIDHIDHCDDCNCGARVDSHTGCHSVVNALRNQVHKYENLNNEILYILRRNYEDKNEDDAEGCALSFLEKYDMALKDYLNDNDKINEKTVFSIWCQVIIGLEEMYRMGYSHGDLHTDNIFIKKLGSRDVPYLEYYINDKIKLKFFHQGMLAILADFGRTRKTTEKDGFLHENQPGGMEGWNDGFMDQFYNQCSENVKLWKSTVNIDYHKWKQCCLYDMLVMMLACHLNLKKIKYTQLISLTENIIIHLSELMIHLTPNEQIRYHPLSFFDIIESSLDSDLLEKWSQVKVSK